MHGVTSVTCLILLFSTGNMLNLFVKESNNFGPYDLSWREYSLCKGPKAHNATYVFTNITEIGDARIGYFNFTYLQDVKLEEIKITVYSIKDNSKNLLWTYKTSDPCQHFAFGGLISVVFKSHDCNVKKGSYYASLNFEEVNTMILGSSFFYGDFLLKSVVMSKKENIMCLKVINSFTKKT